MKLDHILKSARVPEHEPGYWEYFPRRITARLAAEPPARTSRPGWIWTAVTATAMVLVAIAVLWHTRRPSEHRAGLPDPAKLYREMVTLFPNRLEAIIADAHGVRVVLAEEPIKLSSPPLLVKACSRGGCREIITFSGQQVRVNGDTWDVLVTGQNKVIVTGRSTDRYHIESHRLGGVL